MRKWGGFLITVSLHLLAAASDAPRFADRDEAGATFHRLGMEAATAGGEGGAESAALRDALQYLRAAVKAVPHIAEYWNDLGVTEARAGLLQSAKKRFSAALRADPKHAAALQNYNRVKQDLAAATGGQSASTAPPSGKRHHTLPIEVLDDIPALRRVDEHSVVFRRPFIVRGALERLRGPEPDPAHPVSAAAALEHLRGRHGEAPVDFYPQNMLLSRPAQMFFLPLARAIDQIVRVPDLVYRDVDASLPGSYAQWNLNLTEWKDLLGYLGIYESLPFPFQSIGGPEGALADPLLACLRRAGRLDQLLRAAHWFMLLLGEKGAGMHNHQDDLRTASFQLQIAGRKKWSLCPPVDATWDGADWAPRAAGGAGYMYGPAAVNMFSSRIDYEKHSMLVNATCFQGIVQPGDLIYYPKDFWHQTLNMDTPTLSVSGNVVTPECAAEVVGRLHGECAAMPASPPGPALCAAVDGAAAGDGVCDMAEASGSTALTPQYKFDAAFCQSVLFECPLSSL